MVGAAAGAHRVFLQGAQAGRGLAGADDRAPCAARRRRPASRSRWRCRDRWQRKLSAVRSAVRMPRAGPSTVAMTSPGAHHGCRRAARCSMAIAGSSRRKASAATSSPATTPGWRAASTSRGSLVGRDDRVGGDVAGPAEVLEQRGAHQRLDHEGGKRREVSWLRHSRVARLSDASDLAAAPSTSASVDGGRRGRGSGARESRVR